MSYQVKSEEIAKRLMPVTGKCASWKGFDKANAKGKDYDKEALDKAGCRTEHTVVIPFFHRDDFANGETLAAGYARVLAEWEKVVEICAANPNVEREIKDGEVITERIPGVTALSKDGKKELELASPTMLYDPDKTMPGPDGTQRPYRLSDLIFDELVSGVMIAIQNTNSAQMRKEAKDILGVPKSATGGSRGSKADSDF